MHWNTRNARLARKSLAVTKPAAGLNVNPDDPENHKFGGTLYMINTLHHKNVSLRYYLEIHIFYVSESLTHLPFVEYNWDLYHIPASFFLI